MDLIQPEKPQCPWGKMWNVVVSTYYLWHQSFEALKMKQNSAWYWIYSCNVLMKSLKNQKLILSARSLVFFWQRFGWFFGQVQSRFLLCVGQYVACLSSFRGTGSTELTDSEGFDRIPQKNIKADDKVMCFLYVCFYWFSFCIFLSCCT